MVTSVYFGKYGFAIGVKRILKRRNGNKLKVMLPICARRVCVFVCLYERERESIDTRSRARTRISNSLPIDRNFYDRSRGYYLLPI